jgi:hypothetical protein
VLVTAPDLLDKMCCGAVSGGIKFCTLGADACLFTTHSKKVSVLPGAIYISTGRQSAFSFHHAPVTALDEGQVERLLEERHSKAEWIRLLMGLNQGAAAEAEGHGAAVAGAASVLNAVTPERKRKVRYEDEADLPGVQTLARGKVGVSLKESFESEGELAILPSEDSAEMDTSDKVSVMWSQWSSVVSLIQRLGGNLRVLKSMVAEDFLDVDTKVLNINASVGTPPGGSDCEECGTIWDGLIWVNS